MATEWAHGTTLSYASSFGGVYTTLAQVVEIEDVVLKRMKIDTSHLTSSANTKTCRAGMVEPDPFKFKLQYSKTVHATLLAFVSADSPNYFWKITLSDGSTYIVEGFIAEFATVPKATNDNVFENNIAVQPVAAGVFTPGS